MARRAGEPTGQCKLCSHPERVRIELQAAGGAGLRPLARKYGLTHHALGRHWRNHVSDEKKAALLVGPVARGDLAERVGEEATSVIDNLRVIRGGLHALYDAAVTAGDRHGGALVAGRLHENLRIVARITGELAQSPLVQINNNQTNVTAQMDAPWFLQLQSRLISILQKHPQALGDVVEEFTRLEKAASVPAPPQLPAIEHHAAA